MNHKYHIEISLSSYTKAFFKEEKDYKKFMNHYKLLKKSFSDRVSLDEQELSEDNIVYGAKFYCNQNEVKFFAKQIEDLELSIDSIHTNKNVNH